MKTIHVILADDHVLVRQGIRGLIERLPDISVVGEAGNGQEALTLIETGCVDIALMDIGMPVMNGIETTKRISASFPQVRVIVLSMHSNEEYFIQALMAGAAGYVLKNAAMHELEIAIRSVAAGQMYLSPAVSRFVVDDYIKHNSGTTSPLDRLTPRQREIFQLIAEGNTSNKIALKLGLSIKTVDVHRTKLMEALGVHEVTALVRLAVRLGIINT